MVCCALLVVAALVDCSLSCVVSCVLCVGVRCCVFVFVKLLLLVLVVVVCV